MAITPPTGNAAGLAGLSAWDPTSIVPGAPCNRNWWTVALFRRQHHDHLTPFESGVHLNLRDFFGIAFQAIQQPDAELLVGHFAATEPQRHLDLVAFPEEANHRTHLHVVIMVV